MVWSWARSSPANPPERRGAPWTSSISRTSSRKFSEHWQPKILARLNDYHIKAVKLQASSCGIGTSRPTSCSWYQGLLAIRLRDREVALGPGELLVVPKGIEHQPVAAEECELLLIEPAGTANTGDAGGDRTAAPSGSEAVPYRISPLVGADRGVMAPDACAASARSSSPTFAPARGCGRSPVSFGRPAGWVRQPDEPRAAAPHVALGAWFKTAPQLVGQLLAARRTDTGVRY